MKEFRGVVYHHRKPVHRFAEYHVHAKLIPNYINYDSVFRYIAVPGTQGLHIQYHDNTPILNNILSQCLEKIRTGISTGYEDLEAINEYYKWSTVRDMYNGNKNIAESLITRDMKKLGLKVASFSPANNEAILSALSKVV